MDHRTLILLFVLLITIVQSQSTSTILSNGDANIEEPKGTLGDLQPSESTIRFFVMNPESEKNEKPDNGITSAAGDDDDDGESEELKMPEILESLLDGDDVFGEALNENNTEQDDNISNKLDHKENGEPLIASNSDDIEARSQTPEFNKPNFSRNNFEESKEESDTGRSSTFEPENNRFRNEAGRSPIFHLTQGGYQRPFQTVDNFQDQRQSIRSESAPQQAETIQTSNDNENSGRARVRQQSTYNSIFQPPFIFQPGPVFRHPFAQQPVNFANANGRVPSDIQNSFYNTQPDFSQGQYPQLNGAGDFPTIHFPVQADQRNPFMNSEYLFQAPFQIPVSQSIPARIPEQMPQFFQHAVSPMGYSNPDNAMNSAGSGLPTFPGNSQQSPQYQENPNIYNSNQNLRFASQALGLMPNYPVSEERSQLPPRFINPQQRVRIPVRNIGRPEQIPRFTPTENDEKQTELLTETPNKEDPVSVPFGARIQKQSSAEDQNNFERQDNVYMRYPMTEAGYATEESLPSKNSTDKESKENDTPVRQPFPFFTVPRSYNVYTNADPYRAALASVQRGFPPIRVENNENQNETEGNNPELFSQGLNIIPNQARPEGPTQFFRSYPERNPGLSVPETPFYPIQSVNPNTNPFEPIAIFPENHFQFVPRPTDAKEQNQTPICAKNSNDSICFEDQEYPSREIMYVLNADSFLTQRMLIPDQQLDKIPLVDQNSTEGDQKENYICKSEIKYGLPLRAQNTKGDWKVIINTERAIGRANFKQPVRLEICSDVGDPCTSVTEIKTACVQKYSLQRLLSWSTEKGVHNDVYRLPIACSCQILEKKE